MSEERVWTARELSEKTGLDDSHIRRLLISGKLQGRKFGHVWMIPDSEVQKWFESRKGKQAE